MPYLCFDYGFGLFVCGLWFWCLVYCCLVHCFGFTCLAVSGAFDAGVVVEDCALWVLFAFVL